MKLRHAAALALVGWYLMMPPARPQTRVPVDLDAPLSKWTVDSSYDTAAECRREIEFAKQTDARLAGDAPNEGLRLAIAGLVHGQCISTDDPRLKPK